MSLALQTPAHDNLVTIAGFGKCRTDFQGRLVFGRLRNVGLSGHRLGRNGHGALKLNQNQLLLRPDLEPFENLLGVLSQIDI